MANPFKDFNCAELLAFTWKRCGKEGIDYILKQNTDHTKEHLLAIAEELAQVGLAKAAAIVTEHADLALPEDDLSRCPYMAEPYTSNPQNRHNIESWLRSKGRKLKDLRRPDRRS